MLSSWWGRLFHSFRLRTGRIDYGRGDSDGEDDAPLRGLSRMPWRDRP